MCGIAAIVSPSGAATADMISSMCDVARHRGPDDEGFLIFTAGDGSTRGFGGRDTPESSYAASYPYAPARERPRGGGHVAFGHRRLSILDPSPAGHQPLSYDNGRFWITFNGEIYNYVELRAELERVGRRFHSHTDTEVILAAFAEWGEAAVARFNGMFAFAVLDTHERTVFLARDRFGVKPLYYWVSPAGFVAFASEIKQFTPLPGWSAALNGQRAYDFLNWRITDHTAETLFEGVYQLRGGEALKLRLDAPLSSDRLEVWRWYSLEPAPFEGTFEEAADRFAELFTSSVGLRLRSDVPVGSCLSGGLDSSAIVGAMAALLANEKGATQKTFSACSQERAFDESEYIRAVVAHTGVEPHYVSPDVAGLFAASDRIAWHQDEPYSTTSVFAQWEVFRIAHENGVKVMLDGQGADEQLAGYHTFFAPRLAGLFRSLHWLEMMREARAMRRVHGYSYDYAFRHTMNMVLPAPVRNVVRRFGARTHPAPDWLDLKRLGAVAGNPFAERGANTSDVRALSVAQLTSTNLQMLLHWEDRDSMAHSIESRVPFLDYRLVEFVLGLPAEYKISEGVTKRVLRHGMRNVLPAQVRMRVDKMGFVTPEELWLRRDATGRFRDAVRDSVERSRGILRSAVANQVDRIIAGDVAFEPLAWRIISFGAWLRAFDVKAAA